MNVRKASGASLSPQTTSPLTAKGNLKMPISLKNTNSILPYVRYSPQANTMAVAGEDNAPREIPFIGKSFAMDIENGSMG
jgi:hypothetical protein